MLLITLMLATVVSAQYILIPKNQNAKVGCDRPFEDRS
jgi:hypothetical protein